MAQLIQNATNGGRLYNLGAEGESYATIHDAASGWADNHSLLIEIGQDYTASTNKYNVRRAALVFDTSSIPADATISSAIVSLYGWAKDVDRAFNVVIVFGTDLADVFVHADYGDLLDETTSLGAKVAADWAVAIGGVAQENQITLNSTGIAAIAKGGTTRFGVRSSLDIDNDDPTDGVFEYVQFIGTGGYEPNYPIPKITVNYTTPFIPKVFIL